MKGGQGRGELQGERGKGDQDMTMIAIAIEEGREVPFMQADDDVH